MGRMRHAVSTCTPYSGLVPFVCKDLACGCDELRIPGISSKSVARGLRPPLVVLRGSACSSLCLLVVTAHATNMRLLLFMCLISLAAAVVNASLPLRVVVEVLVPSGSG